MQQLSPCYFFAALEKMKNLMQFKGDQYCAFKAIALRMHPKQLHCSLKITLSF